jgi:DNA gyrase/topoisomerase IV subunit A
MKGLGSITDEDAKRYFSDINKHLIPITIHNESSKSNKFGEYSELIYGPNKADQYMEMVYSNTKANINKRKAWVMSCDPKKVLERADGMDEMPIVLFQHLSNIHFALDDCHRSMVNISDGLKPSYRKILYTLFNQGNNAINKPQKVASLAGEVTKFAKYMHGEASLQETIFTMMKYWAGTNNIPLLIDHGSIGSRLGDQHAQARYVFLTLNSISRLIYVPDDDDILIKSYDEGEPVEPEYYVPIIPMTLINGSKGIGTGFSNFIPQHNPYDCIEYIIDTLNKPENIDSLQTFSNVKINPYFPECNVDITITDKGYVTHGRQEWILPLNDNSAFWRTSLIPGRSGHDPLDYNPAFLRITEIPIGCNKCKIIKKIKQLLNKKNGKSINSKDKNSKDKNSHEHDEYDDFIKNAKKNTWPLIVDLIDNSICGSHVQYDKIDIIFKVINSDHLSDDFEIIPMKSSLYTTNMTMIDESNKIIKYNSIYDIMKHYMYVRFAYYQLRKK